MIVCCVFDVCGSALGALGLELAAALPRFSYDVVKLVGGFLVSFDPATTAKPRRLIHFPTKTKCTAVAVSSDNKTIWVGTQGSVHIFNSYDGEFLRRAAEEYRLHPEAWVTIAFDREDVFVVDSNSGNILVCSLEGKLKHHFRLKSNDLPVGVAVDGKGHVFVSDRKNVHVHDRKGGFLRSVTLKHKGTVAQGYGIAANASGQVYCAVNEEGASFPQVCGVGCTMIVERFWFCRSNGNFAFRWGFRL